MEITRIATAAMSRTSERVMVHCRIRPPLAVRPVSDSDGSSAFLTGGADGPAAPCIETEAGGAPPCAAAGG